MSNSPSGIGMNDYILSNRGDSRPRISLLPAPTSVPASASPTRTDYRSNSGSSRTHSSIQQQQQQSQNQEYRPSQSDISAMQDTPPFKKIRLVNQVQQQVPSSQHNAIAQQQHQIAPAETHVKKHVQLQPLRIDTRVRQDRYKIETKDLEIETVLY